jgi:hypothetical protein
VSDDIEVDSVELIGYKCPRKFISSHWPIGSYELLPSLGIHHGLCQSILVI